MTHQRRHHRTTRRQALAALATAAGAALLPGHAAAEDSNGFRLSVFTTDVTPRLGHPLLGGSFAPARSVSDPLFAKGLVLLGPARPIVLLAIDWCELRNDAYARWREVIAAAASTTIDRVLISCVHQHDAPYFDLGAQEILAKAGARMMCDPEFHEQAVQQAATALRKCLPQAIPVTHVGLGQAKIEGIASNRRVEFPPGKISYGRYSTARNAALRELPAGTIDPWLKTLSFWDGDQALAAVTSYATHPMSRYGQGAISADFVGLARARREKDDPSVAQIYLTGCSGDVTAGKFNDGSTDVRQQLAERLYQGMQTAWRETRRYPLQSIACRSVRVVLPFWDTPALSEDALRKQVADSAAPFLSRAMAALGLSSRQRNPTGHKIDLQAIDFGPAQLVLLPAEAFVDYQLFAQRLRGDSFVMAVGFGECAPGYLPTVQAAREGFREEHGYCWVAEGADQILRDGLRQLLLTSK